MRNIYGRKGKNNQMPESYDPSTLLIITCTVSDGVTHEIARGFWESTYRFLLMDGAIIKKDRTLDNQMLKGIMRDLMTDKKIVFDGEQEYTLTEDIYLQSPSAAAKLILGLQSNGYDHWKNVQGVTLGHLAWPENNKYKSSTKTIELMDWPNT